MKNRKPLHTLGVALLALPVALALAFAPAASAQSYMPPPPAPARAPAEFAQQDLDRMLAPIALYPDALLSQILMAATYPFEVVQAARWSQAYPDLQGDQAVRAVAQQDWDPSVKSLVAFPQILAMMDAKPEWTERLGDAFLVQESQVMDTVQNLRQRAYAAGNLQSDDQIRVMPQGQAIVVEPAYPEMVYVPYYDPMVAYGNWWWPAPPVYWAPWRGYRAPHPGHLFSWGAGIPVASGFFFGAFDWQRRHARVVSVNNYYYNRPAVISRPAVARDYAAARRGYAPPDAWQHDAARVRGTQYTGIRQEVRTEIRNESNRGREPFGRAELPRPSEFRREAPPAVRAEPPRLQPGAEHRAMRPAPAPMPQIRAASVARPAPATMPPIRVEMPRPAMPQQARVEHQRPAPPPTVSAPQPRQQGGGPGQRHGNGNDGRHDGR